MKQPFVVAIPAVVEVMLTLLGTESSSPGVKSVRPNFPPQHFLHYDLFLASYSGSVCK